MVPGGSPGVPLLVPKSLVVVAAVVRLVHGKVIAIVDVGALSFDTDRALLDEVKARSRHRLDGLCRRLDLPHLTK